MDGKQPPRKIYIVFHHALFAQGIRSLLRGRRGLRVVGMESDPVKAVKVVGSLRAHVVIVEEPDASIPSPTLTAILQSHRGGRVVALDLDQNFATVYDRHRMVTAQPADLIRVIRGFPLQGEGPAGRGSARDSRAHPAPDELRLASPARTGRPR